LSSGNARGQKLLPPIKLGWGGSKFV